MALLHLHPAVQQEERCRHPRVFVLFFCHERTNTGEKKLCPCSICTRRFDQKSHVAIHERTHTGEKPCPCSICTPWAKGGGWVSSTVHPKDADVGTFESRQRLGAERSRVPSPLAFLHDPAVQLVALDHRRPWSPKLVTILDSKHQSPPHQHGHQVEHST